MNPSSTTDAISVEVGDEGILILTKANRPLTPEEIKALRFAPASASPWRDNFVEAFLDILIPNYRERFSTADLVPDQRDLFKIHGVDIAAGVCNKTMIVSLLARLADLVDGPVQENLVLLEKALLSDESQPSAPTVGVATLLSACLSSVEEQEEDYWLQCWLKLSAVDKVPAKPADLPLSANDIECLQHWLYDEPYKTPLNSALYSLSPRQALVGHIETCRAVFEKRPKKFYSPYCALVQGSGAGKTRLAMECKEDFFVIYICLRKPSSSGYPPRTTGLADALLAVAAETDIKKREKSLLRFFSAMFTVISSDIAPLVEGELMRDRRRNFFDLLHRRKEEELGERVRELMGDIQSTSMANCKKLIADTLRDLERGCSPSYATVAGASTDSSSFKPQSSFLFVLDEALELTKNQGSMESLFFSWRRTIGSVESSLWFFLLLDTSSTVSNFLPDKDRDLSDRASKSELFPPFYVMPFTGPWELTEECKEACASYARTEPALDELNLAAYSHNAAEVLLRNSRLMYCEHATRNLGMSGAIDFAISKLCGIDETSPNKHIPLLCYLYSLRPSAQNIKDTLIRDCSATLMLWSRDQMVVDYEPEPIFGEAAMVEMTETLPFSSLLRELSQRVAQGDLGRAFSVGDKGEFVAAVYLLEAMRRTAVQRRPLPESKNLPSKELYSTLIPMHKFLSILAGGRDVLKALDCLSSTQSSRRSSSRIAASTVAVSAAAVAEERDSFQRYCWVRCLHSMMNFTRFSQAHSTITSDMLRVALHSRIAFFARPGEKATDAIVPADLRADIDHLARDAFDAFAAKLRRMSADKEIPSKTATHSDVDSVVEEISDVDSMVEEISGVNSMVEEIGDMVVLAAQMKNLANHEQVSQTRRWLRGQSSHVLKTTGARFVISILIFTGPGKFTSEQFNGIVPFAILDCREDADDTDMRSLYIVINEFVAVEEESRDLLRQMSAELDIVSVQKKVNDTLKKVVTTRFEPELQPFFDNIDSYNMRVLKDRSKGYSESGEFKVAKQHENSPAKTATEWVALDFATMSRSGEEGKIIVPSSSVMKKSRKGVKRSKPDESRSADEPSNKR